MKRYIAVVLTIITIGICGWQIVNSVDLLDIASNKNDWYALSQKNKIENRTDISSCEKAIMKSQIDFERKNKRQISGITYQWQVVGLIVIIVQFILLIVMVTMSKKK